MKRVALAAVSGLAAFGLVWWRGGERAAGPAPSGPEVVVPEAKEPIALDGALHEPPWLETDARTGALLEGAEPARPHAEARFVKKDGTLWVGLYAADVDIRSSDHFRVTLAGRAASVNARGTPFGGARAASEVDGTLDDALEDEEWTAEIGLALAGVPDRAPVLVERCKEGKAACARFTGVLVLR